jgi:hypothetical protein
MTGDALPSAILTEPGVSEPALVLESLSVVGSLFVVSAGNYRRVAVDLDFKVASFQNIEVRIRVSREGHFFAFANDTSVWFGQHNIVSHKPTESVHVMAEFGLLPGVFSSQDFGGRIGRFRPKNWGSGQLK